MQQTQHSAAFDEHLVIHNIKHYLPSQQALKDFIHHNTLHAFQHMKFYDALFKAAGIFGYGMHLKLEEYRGLYHTGRIRKDVLNRLITAKGGDKTDWERKLLKENYPNNNTQRIGQLRKNWKTTYRFDLDNQVHPLLFRIIAAFLDQGVSITGYPVSNKGFLESIRQLEMASASSFFKTKAVRKQFLDGNFSISGLLKTIVGDEAYFEQYLFDMHFAHPGWSGFVSAVEDNPQTLLDKRKITLEEFTAFELLMELDAIQTNLNSHWKPLAATVTEPPTDLFAAVEKTEFQEVIACWQDAFEWSYYDSVLKGLQLWNTKPLQTGKEKSFQAIFCIDERECSLRRHIESVDPQAETLGAPGFFGVEFYYQQAGSKFYDKLCPAPVTPKYLIKEQDSSMLHKKEFLYSGHSHGLLTGWLYSALGGYLAFIKTMKILFRPEMSPAISDAFSHMDKYGTLTIENKDPNEVENGLQIGYTPAEMTTRAEGFLKNIGLVSNFAPLVYVVAHGSSSANNPHHGAHDCGACSGRPGATNARVMAFILNHEKVRESLAEKGINIPSETRFLGCMHDTAADEMGYYDDNQLDTLLTAQHKRNKGVFENALDLNAKERSRRFASINTKEELQRVRKEIHNRSVSLFEPRPELGHGTNTLAIIGRRGISKGLFLDRRAFLNSYDPTTDPTGEILTNVMKPIGLVCGGINLEYYFSRVDNKKMGAGTKLPHKVIGLFGVANGSDGDLRPGLPWQMIEVHDPVRLLVVVEHHPDVVLKAIQSSPEVFEWYNNEWVHIMAIEPESRSLHYFKEGRFEPYETLLNDDEIKTIDNLRDFIETAEEMETNHIIHATKENLPVYLLD
jgi:uncharacterized protein